VTLREITAENAEEIFTLQVAPGQEDFVANNERSLAQAHFSKNAWYRAIYADETPVGFVMLYDDPETPYYFLWRLMVDGRFQRMGFGAAAVELLKEHVRKRPGAEHLVTSYVPQKGGPGPFYKKLGFEKTGEMEDDEEIVAVALW
jgi:diamine N-acetyltransferase